MQYEVTVIVEGAMTTEELHTNEGAAYSAADRLAEEAAQLGPEITWNVYVTPHYCRDDDGDCVCVGWMPDHKPYRSA